ncbi:penicillin acylase family protein [Nocardioides ferulae]|uniref:penicillin acylase family protein n=1 Tax=Nocardioides ferulae TaxID=2340821 RepID=UPI000EB13FB2|nr:penicillin acylase family protein [Nocardioides ferulae]
MARIYRDAWGVPHVRGRDLLDVARGQGRVTARDRTWQLEHLRRRATGTTAELFGPAALGWDRLARRAGLVGIAHRAHACLDDESRAFVAAYAEGVGAGLAESAVPPELVALDAAPQPWEPWTPLAVFLAQHLLFGAFPGKLWRHRARAVLGQDADLLSHEWPSAAGSNAWAVAGGRTATGLPLVAGDPHRVIEQPGVYLQVRLASEDPGDTFDVTGFALAGVPGVQHFAHAVTGTGASQGSVAWAITNAMADYQDVYAESLRRCGGSGGGVEALGPEGWEPAEVRLEQVPVRGASPEPLEIVTTARGPVFQGGPDEGGGLSLRTASDVLGDLGFAALVPLLRARSVDDVDAALDRWVEPVNNVLLADSGGAVRYRLAGRVPVRAEANRQGVVRAEDPASAWSGWLQPLPRTEVPADGQVVTANERRGAESDAVGAVFAAPWRARRLHQLLEGRTGLTAADFEAFHNDTLLLPVPGIQQYVRTLRPGAGGTEVQRAVLAWDGRMEAASIGAAAFAAWRSALVSRIAAEPVLAPLAEPDPASGHDPLFAPWLDLTGRVALALPRLLAAGEPFGIDLTRLATLALDDAAGHPATWGETHVATPVHVFEVLGGGLGLRPPDLPRLPVSGDGECVRCTGSLPGQSDECFRGSVARYVWDLADRQSGGWVVPTGASGDPGSPHHADQAATWAEGELIELVTDWDRLTEEER